MSEGTIVEMLRAELAAERDEHATTNGVLDATIREIVEVKFHRDRLREALERVANDDGYQDLSRSLRVDIENFLAETKDKK